MSPWTNVRTVIHMARDGNLNDNRPPWYVILFAIFFLMWIFMG
jgi:hypothetical protein